MCRRDIEISFAKRIKEVEDRFSGDQETVEKHFQADVLKLEQHYQNELKALSESHIGQKLHWEAQMQEALENTEEQRRMIEETMAQEAKSLDQRWKKEWHELQSLHEGKMKELVMKNRELQNELDELSSMAQTNEIELSRQLNDLHNRLQKSLETRDELLAQSEKKALETERLLNQTVEDFKEERAELLSSQSELEAKNEMLSILERQVTERIELLTERDDLKLKIEELEMRLQQAAVDFELEKRELQEQVSILEEKLKDNVENDRGEPKPERDVLKNRVQELQREFSQGLFCVEKAKERQMKTFMEEQNAIETFFAPPEICLNNNILADSSPQELHCLLSLLHEQIVETMMEAPHALNDGSENRQHFDNKCDQELVNHSNDDQGEGTFKIKRDPTESKELSQFFVTESNDTWPESPQGLEGEMRHGHPESTSCDGCNPEPLVPDKKHPNAESKGEAVVPDMPCEAVSSLEEFEVVDAHKGGVNEGAPDVSEAENKPYDAPPLDNLSLSHEDELCHETVVDPVVLEEMDDPDELFLVDVEGSCVSNNSPGHRQEAELVSHSDSEPLTAKIRETPDEEADCEDRGFSLLKLQVSYHTATEENILLHEKISLLQQKTEILENLLAHNSEKIKTGHQVLEENYSLKVKMLLLMEHVKQLEIKAIKMTALQIRYDDCMCENAKLKEQNGELEKRVWSLESRMNIFPDFQNHSKILLVDEVDRMREENSKLSELLCELERQREILSAGQSLSPTVESLLDLTHQLGVKSPAATELQDCCEELENENSSLRRAIVELQDKSQTLNETTHAHR